MTYNNGSRWAVPVALAVLAAFGISSLAAEDLMRDPSWSALASDRVAHHAGDSLTVIVYENSSGANAMRNGTKRNTEASAQLQTSGHLKLNEKGSTGFGHDFRGSGETSRSGRITAQVSVFIDEILPNGDFAISGAQNLLINGEKTHIRIRGRIRPHDVSPDNTVLSTRIAGAEIDYNGSGFISRGSRPGIVTRIFNWLGFF